MRDSNESYSRNYGGLRPSEDEGLEKPLEVESKSICTFGSTFQTCILACGSIIIATACLLSFSSSSQPILVEPSTISVFQTTKYDGGLISQIYLENKLTLVTDSVSDTDRGQVIVNSSIHFQEILGFGAALTDAAAINFWMLPKEIQDFVIDSYFGPDGIGYTIGRIPMNSCDFSVDQYSFDNVTNDFELEYFDSNVSYDQQQRIPLLREILNRQPDMKLFTSPWSPPAWMKVPVEGNDGVYRQSMTGSASPAGLIDDPDIKMAWALYFSKFISAYKTSGIDLWGVTIQNESENPGPWEACVWNSTSEASFLRDYLGPMLRRDHPDVKIMAYDHNKDHMVAWTEEFLKDPEVAQYMDGMAFHWYFGGWDRGLDGSYGWGNVAKSSSALMEMGKFALASEGCNCPNVDYTVDGSWFRAEKLAHDILADIQAGSVGWVDWNLLLDYDGGPNHLGNLCDAPMYANPDHTDVVLNPMFHYMGHISKFVPPGSILLSTSSQGKYSEEHLGSRSSNVLLDFEVTLWPCDYSVRQRWELTSEGHIMLVDQLTEYYEYWKPVCLGTTPNEWTDVITIVTCDDPTAGVYQVLDNGYIQLLEDSETSAQCLSMPMESLVVNAGTRVTLQPCSSTYSLVWEIGSSFLAEEMCLTAGWPWFTSASFLTPDENIVVVVLNEAEESVDFDLILYPQGELLEASIPPRSIQTYSF